MNTLTGYIILSVTIIVASYCLRKSSTRSSYTSWLWGHLYLAKHVDVPNEGELFYFLSKHAFRLFALTTFMLMGPVLLIALVGDLHFLIFKTKVRRPGYKPKDVSAGLTEAEIKKQFPHLRGGSYIPSGDPPRLRDGV